jgi:hypothetical protein
MQSDACDTGFAGKQQRNCNRVYTFKRQPVGGLDDLCGEPAWAFEYPADGRFVIDATEPQARCVVATKSSMGEWLCARREHFQAADGSTYESFHRHP